MPLMVCRVYNIKLTVEDLVFALKGHTAIGQGRPGFVLRQMSSDSCSDWPDQGLDKSASLDNYRVFENLERLGYCPTGARGLGGSQGAAGFLANGNQEQGGSEAMDEVLKREILDSTRGLVPNDG